MENNNRPDEMVCPICDKMISEIICYETIMCLSGLFTLSSVPEMHITDRKAAKAICDNCPYSDIS